MPPAPAVPLALFALNKIGVRVNFVNLFVLISDPPKYIEENDTEILMTLDDYLPVLSDSVEKTNLKKIIVVSLADNVDIIPDYMPDSIRNRVLNFDSAWKTDNLLPHIHRLSLKEFLNIGRQSAETVKSTYKKGETAVVLYTGGSTGIPKGIEKRNEEFLAMGVLYTKNNDLEHKAGDRIMAFIPPNHPTSLVMGIVMPWFYGVTLVFQPIYNKANFPRDLWITKANIVMATSSHYSTLLACDLPDGALPGLKLSICAGEPVTRELALSANRTLKRLGAKTPYILPAYGMSEVGPLATLSLGPETLNKVGPPVNGAEARIVDDQGMEVGNNIRGNIQVKTPYHMKCYFKQPELTKAFFTEDGFAITGDVGMRDDNGDYDIFGRAEDAIIAPDGSKVYLFDIERVVYQDEAVLEGEVVGQETPEGKVPVVHIVLRSEYADKGKEAILRIHKLCQEQLWEHEMPRGYKIREMFDTNMVSGKRDSKKLLLESTGFYMVEGDTLREVSFPRKEASFPSQETSLTRQETGSPRQETGLLRQDDLSYAGRPEGRGFTVDAQVAGMAVKAMNTGAGFTIGANYTAGPDGGFSPGAAGTRTVTVSCTEGSITQTISFTLTVSPNI
jgi:long-chain acyl-CoA synthetase